MASLQNQIIKYGKCLLAEASLSSCSSLSRPHSLSPFGCPQLHSSAPTPNPPPYSLGRKQQQISKISGTNVDVN